MPIPPAKSDIKNISSAESSADEMYVADVDEKKPHLLRQLELNNTEQDLSLFKEKAELLKDYSNGIYFKNGSSFHSCSAKLSSFRVCHCPDVAALMEELGTDHVAKE